MSPNHSGSWKFATFHGDGVSYGAKLDNGFN